MDTDQIAVQLHDLLHQQLLGVLATHDGTGPYTSLVAFSASKDLRRIFFVTSRETRKFSNMINNNQVAMLIDNRANQSADFENALAVTILGQVSELPEDKNKEVLTLFLTRHPKLTPFCQDPSAALMEIAVQRYILVNQFDDVHLLDIDSTT